MSWFSISLANAGKSALLIAVAGVVWLGSNAVATQESEKSAGNQSDRKTEKREAIQKRQRSGRKENAGRGAANDRQAIKGNRRPERRKGRMMRTAESISEKHVFDFVAEHHKDLGRLLNSLKKRRPEAYRRAMSELRRSIVRLENLKVRDEERYEVELQAWMLRSRVQLLTAQLAIRDSKHVRDQLKKTLKEQAVTKRKQLQAERKRLKARLAEVDRQLARAESDLQSEIERRLQMAVRNANRFKNDRMKKRPVKSGKSEKRPGQPRERDGSK